MTLAQDQRWLVALDVDGTLLTDRGAIDPIVVESVKAASDIYSPVSGEVIAVNEALSDSPETLNSDPYASWIFKLKPSNPAELEKLLDAAGYKNAIGE